MNQKTIVIVLVLLALWLFLQEQKSAATSNDKLAQPGASPGPAFGTDSVPNAAQATAVAPLVAVPPAPPGPAPRTLEQAQADAAAQFQNPAFQAAAANPDVAASNEYYGQFIGKIT